MKLSARSKNSGFTLVEILVVIAIIGLIVGISLSALSVFEQKAKDKMTGIRVKTISGALETLLTDFPDDDYTGLLGGAIGDEDSSIELYKLLTGDVDLNGEIDADEVKASEMTELLLPPKLLSEMDPQDWTSNNCWITEDFQIKDAFGRPLRLVLNDTAGFVGEKNSSAVGFDLWSAGQDLKTAVTTTDASPDLDDDIGNW